MGDQDKALRVEINHVIWDGGNSWESALCLYRTARDLRKQVDRAGRLRLLCGGFLSPGQGVWTFSQVRW